MTNNIKKCIKKFQTDVLINFFYLKLTIDFKLKLKCEKKVNYNLLLIIVLIYEYIYTIFLNKYCKKFNFLC